MRRVRLVSIAGLVAVLSGVVSARSAGAAETVRTHRRSSRQGCRLGADPADSRREDARHGGRDTARTS